MTSRQISETYNPGIPKWQHDINEEWIDHTWDRLNIGGIWYYPDAGKLFEKTADGWQTRS